LFACLRSGCRLRRQFAEGADSNAVAVGLHANNAIVVCDHDTWAVESDTTRIELAPVNALGFAAPAVPAQRRAR
jgi:hypothetical protein